MNQLKQNDYLTQIKESGKQIKVYTTKGIGLMGTIESCDDTVIILRHNNELQMIYKHSISCIEPFSHEHEKESYSNRKPRC